MRRLAAVGLVATALVGFACSDDDDKTVDVTPIDPRSFQVGTCVAEPTPNGAIVATGNFDELEEQLGWTPLRASNEYEVDWLTSYVGSTCEGVQQVTLDYSQRDSDHRITLLQGSNNAAVGGLGPSGEPVRLGDYHVQWLDLPHYGIAVFETGGSHNGTTLYASVIADSRSDAEAFIRTLH